MDHHERVDDTKDGLTLELAEEIARVAKREVETGRVRVALRAEEVERVVEETLRRTRVRVERVAINRELLPGEPIPRPREEEDGTTVLPVLEEILVVERRLVLREEVRVTTAREEETWRATLPLRRHVAEVSREPPA